MARAECQAWHLADRAQCMWVLLPGEGRPSGVPGVWVSCLFLCPFPRGSMPVFRGAPATDLTHHGPVSMEL